MPNEPRTKLVCNLRMDDFFTYPGAEGTWRRTGEKMLVRDGRKSYSGYECRQLENNENWMTLRGEERVTLIEKGA